MSTRHCDSVLGVCPLPPPTHTLGAPQGQGLGLLASGSPRPPSGSCQYVWNEPSFSLLTQQTSSVPAMVTLPSHDPLWPCFLTLHRVNPAQLPVPWTPQAQGYDAVTDREPLRQQARQVPPNRLQWGRLPGAGPAAWTSWVLPHENVGPVLPDLLIFQEKTKIWSFL